MISSEPFSRIFLYLYQQLSYQCKLHLYPSSLYVYLCILLLIWPGRFYNSNTVPFNTESIFKNQVSRCVLNRHNAAIGTDCNLFFGDNLLFVFRTNYFLTVKSTEMGLVDLNKLINSLVTNLFLC